MTLIGALLIIGQLILYIAFMCAFSHAVCFIQQLIIYFSSLAQQTSILHQVVDLNFRGNCKQQWHFSINVIGNNVIELAS